MVAFAAAVPFVMMFPLDRVARWLASSGDTRHPEPSPEDVSTLVGRIDGWLARGRPIVRSGCVVRGVTLYRFLHRAGVDVSLRFGVGVVDDEIAGHCWIVYRGEPLAERRDPRLFFSEIWAIAS